MHPITSYRFFLLLVITTGVGLPGCGNQMASKLVSDSTEGVELRGGIQMGSDRFAALPSDSEKFEPSNGLPAKPQEATANRKIIYTAQVSLVVETFDNIELQIKALVGKHGGYIANANLGRMQGERRSGTWTVRVPTAQFEAFLDEAGSIGVPTSRSQDSRDVTEEYVDLEARITNKKKLEARIVELLERPDDKIQHVIEVERELARVREEIERMEGRLRFLSDRIEMTTVVIDVREEKEYTPPQAPTFSQRISKAWTTAIANTQRFLADTSVLLVLNVIPLAAWVIGILIGWWGIRRYLRRRRDRLNA